MQVTVQSRDGSVAQIAGDEGRSLMDAIRGSGNDELLALCGGCCSCATCHVFVDPAWVDAVGAAGEDENDLLDGSPHRIATSRLSCQIIMSPALDGLRVTIAPED